MYKCKCLLYFYCHSFTSLKKKKFPSRVPWCTQTIRTRSTYCSFLSHTHQNCDVVKLSHLLQTDFHFYRRIYCIHTHTPNSNSCSDLNCQNNLFAFKLNLNGIQPTAFVNMSSHCMWAVSLFFFFFFYPRLIQCASTHFFQCIPDLSLCICTEMESREGQYKLPLEYLCNMMR